MADINVNDGPAQVVGPVSRCHVFPMLSETPLMLTDCPFHTGCVETNATRVVAVRVSNGAVVCAGAGVPLIYPTVLTSEDCGGCATTLRVTCATLLSREPSFAL